MHRFTASHRARAQVLWGEVKKQFPSDIPYEVVREEVLRRLTEEEERRTRREAMESLSPGIVADEEENSPPAKRPCSRAPPHLSRRAAAGCVCGGDDALRSHRTKSRRGYERAFSWLLRGATGGASVARRRSTARDHTPTRLTELERLGDTAWRFQATSPPSPRRPRVGAGEGFAAGLVVAFQSLTRGGATRTHHC